MPSCFADFRWAIDGKMKTTTAPQSPPTYRIILPIVGIKIAKRMEIATTIEFSKKIFLYPTFSVFNTIIKNWLRSMYIMRGNTVISWNNSIKRAAIISGSLTGKLLRKFWKKNHQIKLLLTTLLERSCLPIAKPFPAHFKIQFLAESPLLTSWVSK